MMSAIRKVRAACRRRREARAIRLILREMAALGWPIDDMTDEDVIEALERMADALAQVGVSCGEVAVAFAALHRHVMGLPMSPPD